MDCETLRDDLLAMLYGEADAAAQARFGAHQAGCAACREELASLARLRRTLSSWRVPEQAAPRVASAFASWRGMAAAAGLLAALGGALGVSGALAFRLGRESARVSALLAEHELRHRRELAALEARIGRPAATQAVSTRDDAALLERVGQMVRQSEARQGQLLAASLRDIGRQSEAQRRYDLARISAGFSYLEGKTGQQVARTTELMGYVLEASQKK